MILQYAIQLLKRSSLKKSQNANHAFLWYVYTWPNVIETVHSQLHELLEAQILFNFSLQITHTCSWLLWKPFAHTYVVFTWCSVCVWFHVCVAERVWVWEGYGRERPAATETRGEHFARFQALYSWNVLQHKLFHLRLCCECHHHNIQVGNVYSCACMISHCIVQ